MDAITYSELRQNLKNIMDQAADKHEPVIVKRQKGENMVLMSLQDYQAIEETAYLLRSPANAMKLLQSLEQSVRGEVLSKPLDRFSK
jgi:antitoxin YefM